MNRFFGALILFLSFNAFSQEAGNWVCIGASENDSKELRNLSLSEEVFYSDVLILDIKTYCHQLPCQFFGHSLDPIIGGASELTSELGQRFTLQCEKDLGDGEEEIL